MRWLIKKVVSFLSVYYAHMLEYRAEIFFWVLSGSLPIILMGVWIKAAQGGNFALSSVEFARYFFCVFQVNQFTKVWVIWDFEREVIEGKLSFRLLYPVDPVWYHVARHVAEKMTRFPISILITLLFFFLYPEAVWNPKLINFILGLMAIILSFTLSFIIQYTLAMFCFWIERASSLQQFWFLFDIFLSGITAPLDVFPLGIKEIVLLTPFPYTIYFPASLFIDRAVNIPLSFLIMLTWIMIFFVLNRWLWKKGLKQYSGMGA